MSGRVHVEGQDLYEIPEEWHSSYGTRISLPAPTDGQVTYNLTGELLEQLLVLAGFRPDDPQGPEGGAAVPAVRRVTEPASPLGPRAVEVDPFDDERYPALGRRTIELRDAA